MYYDGFERISTIIDRQNFKQYCQVRQLCIASILTRTTNFGIVKLLCELVTFKWNIYGNEEGMVSEETCSSSIFANIINTKRNT